VVDTKKGTNWNSKYETEHHIHKLKFLQQYYWWFKASEMLCDVNCNIIINLSKDLSATTFSQAVHLLT
jgi:hypothetical protein